jgi:hypothetical protein
MIKTLVAAVAGAFIVAGASAPSHAIPASSPATAITDTRSDLIQVRNHKNRKWKNRHGRNWKRGHHWNRRHWHGRRHWSGPRYHGWRRYHARPWNWRSRGCILAGPIWFCP